MRGLHNLSGLVALAAVVTAFAAGAAASPRSLAPEEAPLRAARGDAQMPPLLLPVPEPEPPPSGPPPAAAPSPRPLPTQRQRAPKPSTINRILSNERTLSRWAFIIRPVTARRKPSGRARRMKRMRTYTNDGTPELALVLRELTKPNGAVWLKIRLPMRPNNHTGWVPRRAMGRLRTVRTFLLIRRRSFRATLYRRGRRVWSARLGVGKAGTSTPRGDFYVRERLVPASGNGIYGVFAFGTSAYSGTLTDWPGGGVVGIHGTNQPELIPGRISHGCIRVRNGPMRRLRKLMPLGTPIEIR
jgi:hypothetical protein